MSGFFRALPFILDMEGGYADNPLDHGGATNKGVTQASYDRWRTAHVLPVRPVKEITDEEVQAIYHADYWIAAKCDALPWPVSLAHFDAWVQHRPEVAAKMLQRAAGAEPDGKIGPKTLAAVNAADPKELVGRMLWERIGFYYQISGGDQLTFLRGWLRRMLHLKQAAA